MTVRARPIRPSRVRRPKYPRRVPGSVCVRCGVRKRRDDYPPRFRTCTECVIADGGGQ